MSSLRRYFNTLIYLRPIQIYYQLFYLLKKKLTKNELPKLIYKGEPRKLTLIPGIDAPSSYDTKGIFLFLNQQKSFGSISNIDWNYNELGKLWCYNLNYFEYLHQLRLKKETGLQLTEKYVADADLLKDGLEPYPISLRNINWIKFFCNQGSDVTDKVNEFLYNTYYHLKNNLEYHLLGNHLIENGFSLLFGAYYFNNNELLCHADKILKNELSEQILLDGGHFELSPMYHQIVLCRLLDAINLVKGSPGLNQEELYKLMLQKAEAMLGWLDAIRFRNGTVPAVNDTTHGIAPSPNDLFEYASRLGLSISKVSLKESGYRMIRKSNYELFVDVGNIGPDYIPGHAHSDTFNFVLNINDKPIIVDTGISTYEKNQRRELERSTSAHNTVEINGANQSDVWSGFRVGKRAKIISLVEKSDSILSTHNGYKDLGAVVTRKWQFSEDTIIVTDSIEAKNTNLFPIARLHFHPDVSLRIDDNRILADSVSIVIDNFIDVQIKEFQFCEGFNKFKKAKKVEISFKSSLGCKFHLVSN